MQPCRDKLFARSSLADNEHGFADCGRPGNVLEHFEESRRFADNGL